MFYIPKFLIRNSFEYISRAGGFALTLLNKFIYIGITASSGVKFILKMLSITNLASTSLVMIIITSTSIRLLTFWTSSKILVTIPQIFKLFFILLGSV